MTSTSFHAVEGLGRKVDRGDPDTPFDPQAFEQALAGLQELIIGLDQVAAEWGRPTDYEEPGHKFEDGELTVAEGTLLADVVSHLPDGWDVSILTDALADSDHIIGSYFLYGQVYCGGGYRSAFYIRLQQGLICSWNIEFTQPGAYEDADPVAFDDEKPPLNPERMATIQQLLAETIIQGYLLGTSSLPKALDYVMLGHGRRPRHRLPRRDREVHTGKPEWSSVRGVSPDTLKNNVYEIADSELDDRERFSERRPALEQLDEAEKDSADFLLV